MSKYKFEIGEKVRCVYESCAAFKKGDILKIRAREFHNDETMIYFFDEFYNGLYEHEIEKMEEVKMEKKSYNRMEMLVELKRDNSKVFRNEMGTEFYVNSGELKGRTTDGRIYSPELMFRTETEYYEIPKLFKERIKKGDTYYVIKIGLTHTDYMIREFIYNEDWQDRKMIERCNFFETEEEAQEKLNKILEILKGE